MRTSMPLGFGKGGPASQPNNPESWVEVVEPTTI